jgi:hypothetical protein
MEHRVNCPHCALPLWVSDWIVHAWILCPGCTARIPNPRGIATVNEACPKGDLGVRRAEVTEPVGARVRRFNARLTVLRAFGGLGVVGFGLMSVAIGVFGDAKASLYFPALIGGLTAVCGVVLALRCLIARSESWSLAAVGALTLDVFGACLVAVSSLLLLAMGTKLVLGK